LPDEPDALATEQESTNKPGLLKGCLVLFGVLVLIGTCNRIVNGPPKKQNTGQTTERAQPKTVERVPTAAKGDEQRSQPAVEAPPSQSVPPKPHASLAAYNQIRNGMTYDEVVSIAGPPAQERARSLVMGYETVVFEWTGEGWFGGRMVLTFVNGRLTQKEQVDLQ
jgi:hypothetical protein